MSSRRRCVGFDRRCRNEAKFIVGSTMDRREWCACESCAYEALIYTTATVVDANDIEQRPAESIGALLGPKEAA